MDRLGGHLSSLKMTGLRQIVQCNAEERLSPYFDTLSLGFISSFQIYWPKFLKMKVITGKVCKSKPGLK